MRSDGPGVYDYDNHQFRLDDMVKILSYSHSPCHDIALVVHHPDILPAGETPIDLMLTFGGRTSPMKYSEYKLIFQDLANISMRQSEQINNMFAIESNLNVNMNDNSLFEEDRIRSFLN